MKKARISFTDNHPSLFDAPLADAPLPVHPAIDEAARRMADEQQRRALSQALPEPIMFMSMGSGSSGNCAYVGDREGGFLIDAGVDATTVVATLRNHGISMNAVKGIILTHDHSDHVRYAYALLRHNSHIGLYCTPKTLTGLLRRHNISRRIKDYHRPVYKEFEFSLANFTITPFDVSHDGTDNVGFFISHISGAHTFAVATDLGCITPRVDHYMRRANYIMIEANYDLPMLLNGRYPEYLKHRIIDSRGHLDNEVTASFLADIYSPSLSHVFLCHLSNDNNTPERALHTITSRLTSAGILPSAPLTVYPLPRFDPSQLFLLSQER